MYLHVFVNSCSILFPLITLFQRYQKHSEYVFVKLLKTIYLLPLPIFDSLYVITRGITGDIVDSYLPSPVILKGGVWRNVDSVGMPFIDEPGNSSFYVLCGAFYRLLRDQSPATMSCLP